MYTQRDEMGFHGRRELPEAQDERLAQVLPGHGTNLPVLTARRAVTERGGPSRFGWWPPLSPGGIAGRRTEFWTGRSNISGRDSAAGPPQREGVSCWEGALAPGLRSIAKSRGG